MKLQKDFLVVLSNGDAFGNAFELCTLVVTESELYSLVNEKPSFVVSYQTKKCTIISEDYYNEMIRRLFTIIYGKFADPETPIEDLVNSFKYIHNIFLNEPCED